jgi:hypothetical protein
MGRDKRPKTVRDGTTFLALPHVVLESTAYRSVNTFARALLIDIAMQLKGSNNGRLLCSTAHMKPLGWTSQGTLHKAKADLLAVGLLYETVKGQRPHKASWYAVTWIPLERLPSYDEGAFEGFVRGSYRQAPAQSKVVKNAVLSPLHGLERGRIGPPHGLDKRSASPPHGPIRGQNGTFSSPPCGHHLDKPSSPVVLPVCSADRAREFV